MDTFTIVPTGAYSLRESAEFGFGGRAADSYDGVMRLAFCLDGYQSQVGVELRQDSSGVHGIVHGIAPGGNGGGPSGGGVHGTPRGGQGNGGPSNGGPSSGGGVHGTPRSGQGSYSDRDGNGTRPTLAAVKGQVARVLSLDYDASGFVEVGKRDPVIGSLLEVAPGLLPPLFYSPYEAAVWSVISARRPANQMAEVRRRLSEAHGSTFTLAGQRLSAVPTPAQLLEVHEFQGLTAEKLTRLHGIAHKAMAGTLDAQRLRHIGPDATTDDMQRLKGIGPFYASLITIRAVGFTDVPPADEPMLRELMTQLYHLPEPCTREKFLELAEPWRPYRTWASVLIRAASNRLGQGTPSAPHDASRHTSRRAG